MRSINSFQNNQNHPYFINLNNNNQKSLASLASQYMDMFDPLKANTSLLQKRERQNVEGFYQNDIQKKVKTIMGPRECGALNAMPNLATMLFQQNLPLNQAFQNFPLNTDSFNEQLKLNSLRNFQQIQNMKQQQETLQLLQSQLFSTDNNKSSLNFLVNTQKSMKTMEEVKVKEEYVKQEEVPLSKGSPELEKLKITDCLSENNTTNDSLSEASADKNDFFMPSPTRDEPILAEYTKAFPEWDLATIFSFIKSGKSIEAFEKERKFKMERKLKKQKTSPNKSKQSKTKKDNNL